MALVLNAAPLSILVELDGIQPSLALNGIANSSTISHVVDMLDKLADEKESCVSLDLGGVESMDTAALAGLAGSAGTYHNMQRRLHLSKTSTSVKYLLDKHLLSDIFCMEKKCKHCCSPDSCGIASQAWAIDVFSLPCAMESGREARERVDQIAQTVGFSKCGRADIALAVGEAVANAIEHGCCCDCKGSFTVSCIATTEKLNVTISDGGSGFRLEDIPDPTEALFSERGRGIFCMNAVMDEVSYQFDAGTTVRMVKFGA